MILGISVGVVKIVKSVGVVKVVKIVIFLGLDGKYGRVLSYVLVKIAIYTDWGIMKRLIWEIL